MADEPDAFDPLNEAETPDVAEAPETPEASDTPEAADVASGLEHPDDIDQPDGPEAAAESRAAEDPEAADAADESAFPGLPDLPKFPSFRLPPFPGLPNFGLPKLPGFPNLPNLSFPGLPAFPNFPRLNLPNPPAFPTDLRLPDAPRVPDLPGAPKVPGTADTPRVPDVPGAAGAPDAPGTPNTPGTPRDPGPVNSPKSLDAPDPSSAPNSPDTPGPSSTSHGAHDSMELAVLEVYAPPHGGGTDPVLIEEVPLQFNPARLELVKEASWARHNSRSAPHASVPEFTGSRPCTLAMTVTFDEPDPGRNSVDGRVAKLLTFCVPTEGSLDAEQPSTPWVRFRWGGFESVSFLAVLRTVKASYTRFSPQGNPLRAVCDLVLEEVGGTTKGQNPTSGSPSSQRSCVLRGRDSLPIVAFADSGRAADWRRIAELNGVDDPWKVKPGQVLLLPGGASR